MESGRKGGANPPSGATNAMSAFATFESNRRIVMKALVCMVILTGSWVSAMTGFALAPAHSCLFVNHPPASLVWERPGSFASLTTGPLSPVWAAGAVARSDWRSLSQAGAAWLDASVLRAAPNDVQPVPFPAEDSQAKRRADAALTDARVNAGRCDRVLRVLPRRPDGRFRVARLSRNLAQNS